MQKVQRELHRRWTLGVWLAARCVDPATTASEYSWACCLIIVVNAAGIIAGEKPVTDLGVTAVDDKTGGVKNRSAEGFLS